MFRAQQYPHGRQVYLLVKSRKEKASIQKLA